MLSDISLLYKVIVEWHPHLHVTCDYPTSKDDGIDAIFAQRMSPQVLKSNLCKQKVLFRVA